MTVVAKAELAQSYKAQPMTGFLALVGMALVDVGESLVGGRVPHNSIRQKRVWLLLASFMDSVGRSLQRTISL